MEGHQHQQPPVSPSQLSARELFNNFHYIWAKLRSGEEECKDVEWKRRTQFVLEQLRTGDTLTRRWGSPLLTSASKKVHPKVRNHGEGPY